MNRCSSRARAVIDFQYLHPDLQHFVSQRMGATVVEVESNHVPMLSKPEIVINTIRKAVTALQKR